MGGPTAFFSKTILQIIRKYLLKIFKGPFFYIVKHIRLNIGCRGRIHKYIIFFFRLVEGGFTDIYFFFRLVEGGFTDIYFFFRLVEGGFTDLWLQNINEEAEKANIKVNKRSRTDLFGNI